jgi:hypothetical protein
MKVKTFTGSETAKVDKRVNDWLAQFDIKPHHTNTAIGQFTVKGEDQRTGKPVNRRAAVIAISVFAVIGLVDAPNCRWLRASRQPCRGFCQPGCGNFPGP